jgi:uncharacterized membrane protein
MAASVVMPDNLTLHDFVVKSHQPGIRRIDLTDLRAALAAGLADFSANRTDVIFLGIIYPVVGLVLSRAALGHDVLPLLFPLAAGFAILGPFAAVGLYELSRRRELGLESSWRNAFDVLRSRASGAILLLGLLLTVWFLIWLLAATALYRQCLGAAPPASVGAFAHDVLLTPAGWTLILLGNAVGLLFAVVAFTLSVVSFPLLLDREVAATFTFGAVSFSMPLDRELATSTAEKVSVAVHTSMRAVLVNPRPMAAWGMTIAGLLLAGSLPCFVGLAVVMPVLGRASWHLYRRIVET